MSMKAHFEQTQGKKVKSTKAECCAVSHEMLLLECARTSQSLDEEIYQQEPRAKFSAPVIKTIH